jgi:voltage-gated potassium channel Kch
MDRSANRARREERWRRRAAGATDAFGLVLGLVLVTFILTSLVSNEGWGSVLLVAVTGATAIVALTSSHAPPQYVRIALGLSALSVVLAIVGAIADGEFLLGLSGIVQVTLLGVATISVLIRVITSVEVNARTILGAISVYTALGLLFAFTYETVGRIQDTPFFSGEPHIHHGDYLFFSYTTLTTTGYGDLVPAGQPGEMIATFEMLIGQIFLVTLVAGLVSLWRPGEGIKRRREARRGAEAEGSAEPTEPGPLAD